jgi:DNA-binding Xre family transcriptional regulator
MKIETDLYKTKSMKEILRWKAEASAEIDKIGLAEFNRRSQKRAAAMMRELKNKHGVVLKERKQASDATEFIPGDAYWLGTNIFRLRRKKGLSDEQLAKAIGISTKRLRDIQNAGPAIYRVNLETLSAIADALGVETGKLFQHSKNFVRV